MVAIDKGNDPDVILRSLRQGASEFLFQPFVLEQVGAALDRLKRNKLDANVQSRELGKVYCVMPGKAAAGVAGIIKMIQRGFGKVAPLVILIAPSFYWCVLAGAARMRLRLFITLNIIGTIGRLILIRLAGDAFHDELKHVLDWIQRYQWWLVGLSLVLVALQVFRGRERGTLETPMEMAAEIEAEEESLRDE